VYLLDALLPLPWFLADLLLTPTVYLLDVLLLLPTLLEDLLLTPTDVMMFNLLHLLLMLKLHPPVLLQVPDPLQ
jgi:hypothetical protein